MHELQVTQSILETVLDHARRNNVERIVKIHLEVGALNDMKGEWMQRYFDTLSENTPAEGAVLQVHELPAGFTCHDCRHEFDPDLERITSVSCPACGGTNCTLERGREFGIRDMEVL